MLTEEEKKKVNEGLDEVLVLFNQMERDLKEMLTSLRRMVGTFRNLTR